MQNLQQNITTLFDPDVRADEELYHLTEQLASGLPSLHGNALLLMKLGIPTPSAGLALPRKLRERMTVELHSGASPGKDFVRHVRPRDHDEVCDREDARDHDEVSGRDELRDRDEVCDRAAPGADPGGPVYQLRIDRLPVPQKHQVVDRVGR
jgi:hypothetical protein